MKKKNLKSFETKALHSVKGYAQINGGKNGDNKITDYVIIEDAVLL